MKKIVSNALALMLAAQMLPVVYANENFSLRDISVTSDNKIQIEFSEEVGENALNAVYYYNANGDKVLAKPQISEEDATKLLLDFPKDLQNQSVKLVVDNELKAKSSATLDDVYMYSVAQAGMYEDFDENPGWKMMHVSKFDWGSESFKNCTDIITVKEGDESFPQGKLSQLSRNEVTREGMIVPDTDLNALTSKKSTLEFTLNPVVISDGSASSPQIFVNLSKLKRPDEGEYTNSQWQLTPNGYGISLNWGNLILHKYTYQNESNQSISGGGQYSAHTHSFGGGYKSDKLYRIKIVTTNTDNEVQIDLYIAEIDDEGNWRFESAKTYTDKEPVSTTGGFGISHWACGNDPWTIDDLEYVSELTVTNPEKASTYVKQAESKINEILEASEITDELQETVNVIEDLVQKLELFGVTKDDITGYYDYSEKIVELKKFKMKSAYNDPKNADLIILEFNKEVDGDTVSDGIYMADDNRTKLDADIYVNTGNKKQVMVRIPVNFKGTGASIVVDKKLETTDGTALADKKVARLEFVKKYDDFSNGETNEWVTVTTTAAETPFEEMKRSERSIRVTENGYFKDSGWFWDSDMDNRKFTNTIVETELQAGHKNMSGWTLFTRVSDLSSSDWKYWGNSYLLSSYDKTFWISKTPNDDGTSITNSISYGGKRMLAQAGAAEFQPGEWYRIRFVTTTLEDNTVKLDAYVAKKGEKFTKPLMSYIDKTNPLLQEGISTFNLNGQGNYSFDIDYYSMSSDAEIIGVYSIDELKAETEKSIEAVLGKSITAKDREEVFAVDNGIKFLTENGIKHENIARVDEFESIREKFPSIGSCEMKTTTEKFTIEAKFSLDMDMSKISEMITLTKDGEKVSDCEFASTANKITYVLHNDRDYDSTYELKISGDLKALSGIALGDDYIKTFKEIAPISVEPLNISKADGKITVKTKLVSDKKLNNNDYSLLLAVMTKHTDEDGKTYYKTEQMKLVKNGFDNISTVFNDVEGEKTVYAALYESDTMLDLLYKEQAVITQ